MNRLRLAGVSGALVVAWGLLTAFEIAGRSWSGHRTDGSGRVVSVTPGSPAQKAGLQAGDIVDFIEPGTGGSGITAGAARWLDVRRGEARLRIRLAYQPLPKKERRIALLGLAPATSFLCCCLVPWFRKQGRASRSLAIAGLGCSMVFLAGPAPDSPLTTAAFSMLRSGAVLAGFIAMLHFLLLFPVPSRFLDKAANARLIVIPALMFWLLLSIRSLFFPAASDSFNAYVYLLAGLVTAFYLLAGVIVFLRRFIRMPEAERKKSGMNIILWGSLAGFMPAAVGFMPAFSFLPGSDYYLLGMVLPPAAWALAVTRAG